MIQYLEKILTPVDKSRDRPIKSNVLSVRDFFIDI